MNAQKLKLIIASTVLCTAVGFPTVSLGENLETVVDRIEETNSILNLKDDIKRSELAAALINYEAAARLKEYQLNDEKMFMAAPGSHYAITAGQQIAREITREITEGIVNDSWERALNLGTETGYAGPIALFQKYQELFEPPNPFGEQQVRDFSKLNIAALLQNDKVEPELASEVITVLTNPYPEGIDVSTILKGVGEGGTISKDMQEYFAQRLLEQAVLSLSVNALGEIASKRLVTGDADKTIMEIMAEESQRRFTDTEWYGAIGSASTEALLRELNHMEAFRLWLAYQQYRLSEQNVSLLSGMMASQAKMASLLNDLSAALDAAATSVDQISPSEFENIEFEE